MSDQERGAEFELQMNSINYENKDTEWLRQKTETINIYREEEEKQCDENGITGDDKENFLKTTSVYYGQVRFAPMSTMSIVPGQSQETLLRHRILGSATSVDTYDWTTEEKKKLKESAHRAFDILWPAINKLTALGNLVKLHGADSTEVTETLAYKVFTRYFGKQSIQLKGHNIILFAPQSYHSMEMAGKNLNQILCQMFNIWK